MALNQMQIKVITRISTLGVVGIAPGLAAQQTISNMIAGIENPFPHRQIFVEKFNLDVPKPVSLED